MVALNQTTIRTDSAPESALKPRKTPPDNNSFPTNRIRSLLRARYYDPHTAEFLSTDPLEYVDGMSLFRGYFVGVGVDANGTSLTAIGVDTNGDTVYQHPTNPSWCFVKIRDSSGRHVRTGVVPCPTIPTQCEKGCTVRIRNYPQVGACGFGHGGLIIDPNCNKLDTAVGGGATMIDGDGFNNVEVVPNCPVGWGLPKKHLNLPDPLSGNPFRPNDISVFSLSPAECACLLTSKEAWATVPLRERRRDDINRNSNWVAKCLLKRCGIKFDWGWRYDLKPVGWDGNTGICLRERRVAGHISNFGYEHPDRFECCEYQECPTGFNGWSSPY